MLGAVYAMAQSEGPGDHWCDTRRCGRGHLAVTHLIEFGKGIAHITGPRHFEAACRRARGAMTTLAQAIWTAGRARTAGRDRPPSRGLITVPCTPRNARLGNNYRGTV